VGSIVLVPSGDKGARVAIEVALHLSNDAECGAKGEKCIVARRVLRYARHTRLVLPIALREVCAGVPCPIEQTCSQGVCVSADLQDPDTCVLAGTCPDGSGASGGGLRDGAVEARDKDASSGDAWAPGDGGCLVVNGAQQPSYGRIDCPNTPCPLAKEYCCTDGPSLGSCYMGPPTGTCVLKGCDEDADCSNGYVCCVSLDHTGGGHPTTTFACAQSCALGAVHVCKTTCACDKAEVLCAMSPCGMATCGGQCPP
jgi:hypothetical protein